MLVPSASVFEHVNPILRRHLFWEPARRSSLLCDGQKCPCHLCACLCGDLMTLYSVGYLCGRCRSGCEGDIDLRWWSSRSSQSARLPRPSYPLAAGRNRGALRHMASPSRPKNRLGRARPRWCTITGPRSRRSLSRLAAHVRRTILTPTAYHYPWGKLTYMS